MPPLGPPASTALLIVDMQNDFLLEDAPLPAAGGLGVIPVISGLASVARACGMRVVFTKEMHRADHSDFGIELDFEPPHCIEGTTGPDIVIGLAPEPGDIVIEGKRRYNGFLGTDLDLVLRAGRVENLIVTGVCTDVCVSATVQHARNLDYRCFVVRDAVAGTSPERHEAALMCLEHVFARVVTAEQVMAFFGPEPIAIKRPVVLG
ncbi:MAG: cysteine hydrolase family protein [Acidimicrobiales bacterium]